MVPPRLRPRLLALLIPVLVPGCASVSVHGVIRTPGGDPVADASVTLTDPETGRVTARAPVDLRGCFTAYEPVKSGERPYLLRVFAPGYKPLELAVRTNETPLVLVTLAADSSPDASASRPIGFQERYAAYDDACAPVGIGPR